VSIGDIITLAALAAVVFAVFWGRRRGRERFAASMAAARAEGHADARAELAAQLTQSVTVVAGNESTRPTGFEGSDDVLIAALRRIALGTDNGRDHDNDLATLDHYNDRARLVERTTRSGDDIQFSADWSAGDWNRVVAARGVDGGEAVT
jgi:hypothetical protein